MFVFAITPSSGAFRRGAIIAFFVKIVSLLKVLLDKFVRLDMHHYMHLEYIPFH